MQRRKFTSLFAVALFSITCSNPPFEPVADTPQTSPPPSVPVVIAQAEISTSPPIDARYDELRRILNAKPMGLRPEELDDVTRAILEESDRHEMDVRLILALIHVESRFQNFIVSPVGAIGLMQILPSTGEEMARRIGVPWDGAETLFDPASNVRIGVAYVKQLKRRYGEINTALAAYNWGMGTIDKRLRSGTPVPVVYPGLVMDAFTTKYQLAMRS